MNVGSNEVQHGSLTHEGDGALLTSTRALTVFLAYDKPDAARSALAFLDNIAARAGAEVGLETRVWRIDLIEDSEFSWQARADAASADLMVVALAPPGTLSAEFARWVDEWAEHGEIQESALALWSAGTIEALTPAAATLRRISERHGLTFVCGKGLAAVAAAGDAGSQPRAGLSQSSFPTQQVPLGEWGINE